MTEPKFMTPAHRRAYLTHLNRCKAMDSYHRALIYTLTAVPALRNNIESCFGFERDEIKPESLAAGWQTTGTTKLTRFAYNLWNGYDDKSCTPYELFDCSFAPYMEVPFFDPLLIIEKTNGRMAGDHQWVQVIHNTAV